MLSNNDLNMNKDIETIRKAIRIINLNNLTFSQCNIEYKDGIYHPILNRGDVVRCEFVGIGTEIDNTHYAVVWDAPINSESITVIPITSKEQKETKRTFSIGNIRGFFTGNTEETNKESFVYLNKIKEISRKRVTPWIIKNSTPTKIVKIDENQKNRIKDAIMVALVGETCLLEVLEKETLQLPIVYDNNLLKMGYRRVIDYSTDKRDKNHHIMDVELSTGKYKMEFFYPTYSIEVEKMCNYIKFHQNTYKFRKEIIDALFSNEREQIKEAKAIICYFYTEFINRIKAEN